MTIPLVQSACVAKQILLFIDAKQIKLVEIVGWINGAMTNVSFYFVRLFSSFCLMYSQSMESSY